MAQLSLLEQVNGILRAKYGCSIDIGINAGQAIGDSINPASCLEGLCRQYVGRIIVSQFTGEAVRSDNLIREWDRVCVKGKQEPEAIHEVLSDSGALPRRELGANNVALTQISGGSLSDGAREL